jgi:hypothetical protein
MKKAILVSIFVFVSVICFNAEVKAQSQQITVTRELAIGFDTASNTWAYNWTVKVHCNGRPPKDFDLTIEQYLELYSDAVNAAIDAGKAKETFSSRSRKNGTMVTEVMKVSTTFQGRCVEP